MLERKIREEIYGILILKKKFTVKIIKIIKNSIVKL